MSALAGHHLCCLVWPKHSHFNQQRRSNSNTVSTYSVRTQRSPFDPWKVCWRGETLWRISWLRLLSVPGTIDRATVTDITVTYAPTTFCTSRLSIAIIVSQFHVQPFICTFIGKCLPGLARSGIKCFCFIFEWPLSCNRELAKKSLEMSGQFSTDNINLVKQRSPLSMSTRPVATRAKIVDSSMDQDIERDGLRIPRKIDSTWAVSKVLLQKKGKVALKDLRRFNELSSENQRGLNRQRKVRTMKKWCMIVFAL